MNNAQWTAVWLALILVAFSFFMLGKASERDMPYCPEGAIIQGFGEYALGRHTYYQCLTLELE